MRWDPAPSHTCQELIWLFSCSLIFLPQSAASLAGFLLLMCGGGKKLLLVFKALVSCSFKISHLLYYAFTFNLQQSMLFLQLFFLLFFFLKQSERKKKKKAAPYPAGRRFAGLCFFFLVKCRKPSFLPHDQRAHTQESLLPGAVASFSIPSSTEDPLGQHYWVPPGWVQECIPAARRLLSLPWKLLERMI